MKKLRDLLEANQNWSAGMRHGDPDFFERSVERQSPVFLWIGCSDSRVPVNVIIDAPPGTVFVHRNIANQAGDDVSSLAVIQYAVETLRVGHIIVCGHYGCGGIRAAMGEPPMGPVGEWIAPIRRLYGRHRMKIDATTGDVGRENLLSELNVREQVDRVCRVESVRSYWRSGGDLRVHGLVYSLADGMLRDLGCSRSGP